MYCVDCSQNNFIQRVLACPDRIGLIRRYWKCYCQVDSKNKTDKYWKVQENNRLSKNIFILLRHVIWYHRIMKIDTQQFLELLVAMTQRELRSRYKNTVFGFLWVVINPILQMLVIGFVFKFFMKGSIDNYYYYLFIGLLVWNFFSLSLTKATPSIVWERNLIKKAKYS